MSVDEHKYYEVDPANSPASAQYAPHGSEQLKHEAPRVSVGSVLLLVVVVLLVLAGAATFGILRRIHASTELNNYTAATSAPPVATQLPVLQQSANEVVIPGNIQAFTLAPIYARRQTSRRRKATLRSPKQPPNATRTSSRRTRSRSRIRIRLLLRCRHGQRRSTLPLPT
jgi:hypothetical protein